jgi:hypothetical protein
VRPHAHDDPPAFNIINNNLDPVPPGNYVIRITVNPGYIVSGDCPLATEKKLSGGRGCATSSRRATTRTMWSRCR